MQHVQLLCWRPIAMSLVFIAFVSPGSFHIAYTLSSFSLQLSAVVRISFITLWSFFSHSSSFTRKMQQCCAQIEQFTFFITFFSENLSNSFVILWRFAPKAMSHRRPIEIYHSETEIFRSAESVYVSISTMTNVDAHKINFRHTIEIYYQMRRR